MPLFESRSLYGSIYVDQSAAIQVTNAVAGVSDKIVGFLTEGFNEGTSVSVINDEIIMLASGVFFVSFTCSFTGSVNTDYEFEIHDSVTGVIGGLTADRKIGASNDIGDITMSGLILVGVGDILHARIKADKVSANFIPRDMNFTIHSI